MTVPCLTACRLCQARAQTRQGARCRGRVRGGDAHRHGHAPRLGPCGRERKSGPCGGCQRGELGWGSGERVGYCGHGQDECAHVFVSDCADGYEHGRGIGVGTSTRTVADAGARTGARAGAVAIAVTTRPGTGLADVAQRCAYGPGDAASTSARTGPRALRACACAGEDASGAPAPAVGRQGVWTGDAAPAAVVYKDVAFGVEWGVATLRREGVESSRVADRLCSTVDRRL